MLLENFQLRYNPGVELIEEGHNWDIHNFADFASLSSDARAREIQLKWVVPKADNPWGDPTNHAPSCTLTFSGVVSFEIKPRRSEPPPEEDLTLEEIACVRPGQSADGELVLAGPDDIFALHFAFCSGAVIEVLSERVRLSSGTINEAV